ncbi:hypothetical protein C9I94_13695 [Photobacterium swingsii]|uniref:Response regulator n=1 Tax=Photobacterium swingsii TaxID=680026 RepID=A0A2T3P5D2_9GAMM|nr:hypothetical protein [Photobacterium swingsii]PSW23751.1 hypothetical protein C9I94_13695 [Photobacterium swingsii]
MSKAVALNEHIYNLLIVKDLDHFTVTELRDALVKSTDQFDDENEARKFIYRQISRLFDKGLLEKQPGSRWKSTVYFKSTFFNQNRFVGKSRRRLVAKQKESKPGPNGQSENSRGFLEAIRKEKSELEALQEIALREMDKYQEVLSRFPDESSYVRTFFLQARERAKNMQGDLEALTKLLMNYPQSSEKVPC